MKSSLQWTAHLQGISNHPHLVDACVLAIQADALRHAANIARANNGLAVRDEFIEMLKAAKPSFVSRAL